MGLLWGHDEKTCYKCGMKIPSSARRCPFCLENLGDNSLFDDIHQYGCLGLPIIGLIILGCFWLVDKYSNPQVEYSSPNAVSYSGSTSQISDEVDNGVYRRYKIKVTKAPIYRRCYDGKMEFTGEFLFKGDGVTGYTISNVPEMLGIIALPKGHHFGRLEAGIYVKLSDVSPLR